MGSCRTGLDTKSVKTELAGHGGTRLYSWHLAGRVQDQPGLQSNFQASQGYTETEGLQQARSQQTSHLTGFAFPLVPHPLCLAKLSDCIPKAAPKVYSLIWPLSPPEAD